MTKFMVVNIPLTYNAIIGRHTLNRISVVVSTYHMIMKFPTNTNSGKLRSNPRESHWCHLTMISLPKKVRPEVPPTYPRDSAKSYLHPKTMESLIKTPLDKAHPDLVVKDEARLPNEKRGQLISFLRENIEVFAWSPRDMSRIDASVAQRRLNISLEAWPIKQKPHKFAPDYQQAISNKVDKLLGVGFITEVQYL